MAAQLPKVSTCNTHPQEEVALFCISCDEGICMTCVTENSHGQHKLCKPLQIIEVKKTEFKKLMQEEGEDHLCKKISEQIELIDRHKATVSEHQGETSTAIAKRSEELVQLIEKEKASLLIHSKSLHDKELNLLSDQKSVALRCLPLLEKHRSDPESFLRTHQEEMQQVTRDLKLVQAFKSPVDIKSVVNFNIGQPVTEADVRKMFGTIQEQNKEMEQEDRHMKLVNIYKPKFPNSSCSTAITKISPIDMQTAFVLLGDCEQYKVQFDVHENLPAKLVAEGVKDITQVRNNYIYLCTGTQLSLFNLKGDMYELDEVEEGQLTSVVLTSGDVLFCIETNETEEEESIEYLSATKEVIEKSVTYSSVWMIGSSGITHCTGTYFCQMYRIERSQSSTYFVEKSQVGGAIGKTYRDDFIDELSTKIYTGNLGTNPAARFDPRGICFDNMKQIIIADCRNSALHLLNKKGEFEKFLLRKWDGLKRPTAITLYNRFLWIGQEDGSIQVRNYEQT